MTRLSPLETRVLDALADELRFELPDLPGQIAESLVGVRRNTGAGFFTEIIVDRSRPPPDSGLSGRLGTIHGDIPGLIEPVAFQIEVAGGRLMALHASTYDEPTGHIDFLITPVSGLFRINDQGDSIPWSPRILTVVSPLLALQKSDEPYDPRYDPPPPPARYNPLASPATGPAPVATPTDLPEPVLVAGAIGLMVLIGVIAIVLFRLPFFFALILFGYGASALRQAKVRAVLRKAYEAVRAEGRT